MIDNSTNREDLKAIIESGSTKSDFVVVNGSRNIILRTQIKGLNPLFNTLDDKIRALDAEAEIKKIAPQIKHIEFYGAGCSNASLMQEVKTAFQQFFTFARCDVHSDMMAACKAVYDGKNCLVGILGTGSNMCYYDGYIMHKEVPSLGYVLGDEGSGNYMGRILLRDYFSRKLPTSIHLKFEEYYKISIDEVLELVYKRPKPNAYLAKFNAFIYKNKEDEYLQKLISHSFEEFYSYQILPYHHLTFREINFVGSIAYLYQNELQKLAEKFNFNIGRIVKSPIEELIKRERNNTF